MYWIHMVQDRASGVRGEHGSEPAGSIKCR